MRINSTNREIKYFRSETDEKLAQTGKTKGLVQRHSDISTNSGRALPIGSEEPIQKLLKIRSEMDPEKQTKKNEL